MIRKDFVSVGISTNGRELTPGNHGRSLKPHHADGQKETTSNDLILGTPVSQISEDDEKGSCHCRYQNQWPGINQFASVAPVEMALGNVCRDFS